MPKQDKTAMEKLLNNKSPQTLRQAIKPVDILTAAAEPIEKVVQPEEPIKANIEEPAHSTTTLPDNLNGTFLGQEIEAGKDTNKSERKKRTENKGQKGDSVPKPKKPHVFTDTIVRSVLAPTKRRTVRYSFEIYEDQKKDIRQICELYEAQHEDEKLSASRLIREVLDTFIPDALKALDKNE